MSIHNFDTPTKYTVYWYDSSLKLHVERIESFRPLHEIDDVYYAPNGCDVHRVVEGWS